MASDSYDSWGLEISEFQIMTRTVKSARFQCSATLD